MLTIAAAILALAARPSLPTSLMLMPLALACAQAAGLGAWMLVTTVIPRRLVASVGGMMNLCGYALGGATPIVVGVAVQRTGSFSIALVIGGGIRAPRCLLLLPVAPRRAG